MWKKVQHFPSKLSEVINTLKWFPKINPFFFKNFSTPCFLAFELADEMKGGLK